RFTPVSATAAVAASPPAGTPAIWKIRLGTLAPKQSPWGKVLGGWAKAVEMKTGGAVKVEWGWNGTQGPEPEVLSKVASGALHGAVLTGAALSDIYRPIAALQMPGAFPTWADLDRARAIVRPEIDRAMKAQGFYLAFWADLGERHIFARGFEVTAPGDLRGKDPDDAHLDLTLLTFIRTAGICDPQRMGVTPAGPRSIDFSVAPASVAGRGSFDHSTSVPAGFEIGALVFSEAALAALPRAYQTILEQMSAPAERQMNLVVRREDAALFAQLSPQLTVTKPTLAQAAEWDHVFKDVCRSLKTLLPGGVVSAIGYC
ncbi:MAG TPA: TRAP transporter substrate-binding protein DctP, partial [Polyangiaceae bacterium]